MAILNECGLILERRKLEKEKQAIELETRQERLRSSLLRAISHDLRTPLTSISGNAGVLMERSIQLDEAKKQQIYASIYDDSMWLINLTENLLSITRIENGTMHLQMEPELLEDVFQEALAHIDRRSAEHTIRVQLDDDLLMARMDARLIVQGHYQHHQQCDPVYPEGILHHLVGLPEGGDGRGIDWRMMAREFRQRCGSTCLICFIRRNRVGRIAGGDWVWD